MLSFTTDNIALPVFSQARVRAWIRAVAADYGKKVGDITYIFCDDERILAVNRQFLQHDY